ncbi:hypothetical protein H1V43_39180 [Streptomyces sp. PSKA54]|uniref:WD40 repeat domain-containing protein n=1 Tax=Streptomyces himalayensis subsp. aureolus TaxID=2758039 RepID=A0A7W2D9P6_9ACTN|nr:hypothetical protein [Streptomyces himalayensis]MBA4867202.1 hypothetical protein [Streptomyces himalayensis subsp. aureolus]
MSDELHVDWAGAGVVPAGGDRRLADAGFLVNAEPGEVLGLADAAAGSAARLAGAVYRASAQLHRGADAGVRRQLLALDAARYGDRELSVRITAVPVNDEPDVRWGVEWATGSRVDHRLRQVLPGHTSSVCAVATGLVNDRPVSVTGGEDGTLRVWDLITGQPVGKPLTGHDGDVLAVVTTVVKGRPVAVTGGADWTVNRSGIGGGSMR